jgi:uncharacterized membrane protein
MRNSEWFACGRDVFSFRVSHFPFRILRKAMNEDRLRLLMSRLMIWGILLAAVVMLAGGVIFLAHHAWQQPGDHKFTGEPGDLRHPVAIIKAALQGNDDCLIQVGVLLMLLNPVVRVAMAAFGFLAGKDRLYAGIAAFVFAVLLVSYFV